MTAKPLFPTQAITQAGDLPSRDLVEIIQRLILKNQNTAGIRDFVKLTQAEYDALTPEDDILYIITD